MELLQITQLTQVTYSLSAVILALTFGVVSYPFYRVWDGLSSIVFQMFSFIILYLTPISNYIHLVIVLIGFDLLTGSYASIKAGDKFSAAKMRHTVEKFALYSLSIIIAYILQRIIDDGNELARIVALYIGSIELKSNYENISRILKSDILRKVWDLINDKIKGYIDSRSLDSTTNTYNGSSTDTPNDTTNNPNP